MISLLLTVVLCSSVSAQRAEWPSVLPRCNYFDPDLDECLFNASKTVIPLLAGGIPVLGIKPLDPLKASNFVLSNDRWPVNLKVNLNDVSIIGPSKCTVKQVRFDKSTSTLIVEAYHKSVRMVGDYKVRGSVFVVPLNSQGTFDFDIRGLYANHTLHLGKNIRDFDHGQVYFRSVDIDLININLKDPSLGYAASRAINRLVNDNWKILSRALKSSMEHMIHNAYSTALHPLFSKFNVNDILPNQLRAQVYSQTNNVQADYKPDFYYYDPLWD